MIESDLETELAADQEPLTPPAEPDPSELLAGLAAASAGAPALVALRAERRAWTWGELAAEVDAVAAGLVAAGLRAGHRLAVSAGNSAEFVVLAFAALRAGIVLVPLDPGLDTAEARQRIIGCGARMVLVAHPAAREALAGELPEVPVRALDPAGLAELADPEAAEVVTPADPEALALLLSTSGISAEPVAAMVSRRALAAHLAQFSRLDVADAESTHAASVPLWTAMGLVVVLGAWLVSGGKLVVPERGGGLAEIVSAEGVTHLPVNPLVILRLLRAQPESEDLSLGGVRLVLSGGGALPADLAAEFTRRTGLAIEQGYGLTECAGVASTLGLGSTARGTGQVSGHGHVGRPLPGIEIRIGDGSDPSEPGEIFVRGAALFSGYWPHGRGGPDKSGWFGTGDLGYQDGEDLFWVDRVREAIVVNGFSVYPAEVEEALGELAGVAAVAVVGAPSGDESGRQDIVAFVVADAGAPLTAEDVLAHGRGRLARFKQPGRVVLLDRLPRVTAGTVSKAALRSLLAQS